MLREMERKRAAHQALEALSSELMPQLYARFRPLRERLQATSADVRQLFIAAVAAEGGLPRRHRDHLREVYSLLMAEYDLLPLSTSFDGGQPDVDFAHSSRDGEQGSDRRARTRTNRGDHQGASTGEQCDAGSSAPRPSLDGNSALRDSFRRLAVALHPDKVQDEAEQVVRTNLMKAVTQAYERGDIARLFELERSWLAQLPVVEERIEARIEKQSQVNKQLRAQIREATESLKRLRASLPFPVDLGSHGGGRTQALKHIDSLLKQAEQEVATLVEIRDRVRDYVHGRTDLGPAAK